MPWFPEGLVACGSWFAGAWFPPATSHLPHAVIGLLALFQSLLSLRGARRWAAFVRSYGKEPGARSAGAAASAQFSPRVTVIVPCRGREHGLEGNLAAYGRQQYPGYEMLLVVSGPEDPAAPVASALPGARVLFAAPQPDEGEKVTKLRAAVREADPRSEVLVFADSDGRPGPHWLSELVRPLGRPEAEVGAATGYRWYLAGPGSGAWFPAVVRAVWNSFIASLLDGSGAIFCWGGATAIRRATFARLDVERYWRGSVSDDYRLSTALREARLPIRFVPPCLVPTYGECGWRELFSWTTRQIRITRVYAPRLWGLGLAAHTLYCAAAVALALSLPRPVAALLFAGLLLCGMATGAARAAGAAAAMPAHSEEIRRLRWAYVLLSPGIPFLMLANFVAAGLTRRIAWRGTSYVLLAPQKTIVKGRETPVAAFRAAGSGPSPGGEA